MRITKPSNLHVHTKLFIIYGAINRGKTTLIHNLVTYMLIHGGEVLYKDDSWYSNFPLNIEHCIVIKYNNKVYGFMSCGDDYKLLRTQTNILNQFKDRKIQVLIGASRTKGGTVEWWNKLANEHNLEYISDLELGQKTTYYSELFNEFREHIGIE